mgnify:CR=1 FL=1
MLIDFTPVTNETMKMIAFAERFSVDDLRAATNASIDAMLALIAPLSDAEVVFEPRDPDAHDPYAVAGEEQIGWNIAHLIAHVTASSEEWATYSPILARGIVYPAEPRLRYETPWKDITTKAQCVQRLEESRRMRLGSLDSWPDTPRLDVLRELSPRFIEHMGEINAPASFLFGLRHEVEHLPQMAEAARQAREANLSAATA